MAKHLGIEQALDCPQLSECDSANWAWANISILDGNYRICSRNLRTFFPPILAAEKSGCVKYAEICGLDLGFILV